MMTYPLTPLLRTDQHAVLSYRSGKMAVLAAPGSGKTLILSLLAASLVDKRLSKKDSVRGHEVLVVTLTNASVFNFQSKYNTSANLCGVSVEAGCRIRTLHGLAHDIVRDHAASVGLPDNFFIFDAQTTYRLIRQLTRHHLQSDSNWLEGYIKQEYVVTGKIPKQAWWQYVTQLCVRFIRHCKDLSQAPGDLIALSDYTVSPLLRFCIRIYDDYQRALRYQGAVDFDDLVVYALDYLRENERGLEQFQEQWPYILEDEAQDSSRLQEHMLRLLSKDHNWVRAGDANQAIHTTFTTADPANFTQFAHEPDVRVIRLKQSGRFGRPIAELANNLQKWTSLYHPAPSVRNAFDLLEITPLAPGDAQRPPAISDVAIHIHYSPGVEVRMDEELRSVQRSLQNWLPNNLGKTVAVLVTDNTRGNAVVSLFRRFGIPYEEILHSTSSVRSIVNVLCVVLEYLDHPADSSRLQHFYREVWQSHYSILVDATLITRCERYLARSRMPEHFLYPVDNEADVPLELQQELDLFRADVRWCLSLLSCSIGEMLVILGRKFLDSSSAIMLCYRLGQILSSIQTANQDWGLSELIQELKAIGDHQREYLTDADLRAGYAPRPGVVTVATLHMSKGLEWNRVYIMGVNNLSFPALQQGDRYLGSKWFVRDDLDLEAELMAQLSPMLNEDGSKMYEEGVATQEFRAMYVRERLRLLYVGITRAQQELIILWNAGRDRETYHPALPLVALRDYLSGTLTL